ncbi:MAG: DUF2344 domain-containing protein [Lachnospiraceae bacterium]|nr:DUF2344 domain-containing protein [Lachnospiraceae bacterium]
MDQIRLKFSKHGPVRFVGHLDVMRYFQRVFRRAGVDIAYSEGYSPHPLMSFAQPLSVGATSDGEYMDFTLRSYADTRTDYPVSADACGADTPETLINRIRAVCREGIAVTDGTVLPEKAEKAMTSVSACAWRVSFRDRFLPPEITGETLREAFASFLERPEIPAVRRTKKGTKEADIAPLIYRADMSADNSACELLLRSGSEDNCKPALFMGALLRHARIPCETLAEGSDELHPAALVLHRRETYMSGSGARGRFLEPLICRDPGERVYLT